ncbi:peptide-binding protein [Aliarcobacter cibarius]|jgi:peptide/nickel transport system substrate-binding protein|uniref:Peptide ABC transporter substrate-binding protein n=1 Tax=Aliarcobacter cibarius TaxID=255507 RepID=A0ABY2V6C6_9BACT|nr:peptide-binding protein [Aliarcobacter cibarius]QEZ89983.1 extracellular solute-binding protein [Aliarcobacter cibarius]TLT01272.1 peptide ABC transporter substrate-binding protein [Aliarcobacter cibarius]TLT01677.1 peptide ABC transporter substrate-binding protein [Aliarcobacter cibarius]
MKFFIFILIFLTSISASTLNLSMSSSPSRLNPILANDSASSEISDWLFNGLFKYDKDGNITPELASSYEFITPTKLIVKLKDNILWHDKVKLTSKDVIFTYEQIINPSVFNSIKSNFNEVQSVKALDDLTVEIIYKKPYFKALEIWMVGLLPYHILKDEKNLMTSSFNKNPIGTGSYKIKEFKSAQDIELIANPDYFDGKPKIDKILYKFLPDPNTSFLYLKQKKLDIGGLTPMQASRQIDDNFKNNFEMLSRPSFGFSYLGFNLENPKFKDIKVRQALSLAINRQELVDILFFGYAKVCNGPFMPGSFAYNDSVKETKQNLEKAKQLLKEAGYDEKNPLSFELITNTGNDIRVNTAQILQYQLAKVGVELKIRVMEWQAFLNTVVHPRKFETVLLGWSLALMPDAYPLWHSSSSKLGGFNLVGYKNEKVDELIEKGSVTINKDELSTIYKDIFKIVAEDLPYLFLYIPDSITAINKKIENIEPAFIGIMHNQKDWQIEE